jgi:hypothetical protein
MTGIAQPLKMTAHRFATPHDFFVVFDCLELLKDDRYQ